MGWHLGWAAYSLEAHRLKSFSAGRRRTAGIDRFGAAAQGWIPFLFLILHSLIFGSIGPSRRKLLTVIRKCYGPNQAAMALRSQEAIARGGALGFDGIVVRSLKESLAIMR